MLLALFFGLLGSVGAMTGAALLLALPDDTRSRLLPWLLAYATGTLLGAAFLGMIPAALAQSRASLISGTVLAGVVAFFLLETLVIWRHCHDANCEAHGHQGGALILIGDAFHNFVDGVVIAAAFLSSPALGVAAALSVIAHEIPQELGDFAILLHGGLNNVRAFHYNLMSSLTTLPGVLLGWAWLDQMRQAIPYVLAVSAASFIYIAVADLMPGLHRHTTLAASARQLVLLLAGIGTIAFFRFGH